MKAIKAAIARTLRPPTRAYIRYAPWPFGRRSAYEFFSRRISGRSHSAVVRTKFGDLMDLAMPDLVSETIYLTGQWEPLITRHIRASLRPGDVFIDVGANVGYYSLLAARATGDTGRVFSIEASPSIYDRLQRNIKLNDCTNVCTINAAASDVKGELPIFSAPVYNLGHSTTVESLAKREGMNLEKIVPADTLEALVGVENLRKARVIKIDVEGAEFLVLSPLFSSLGQFSQTTEWIFELSPDFAAGGQNDVDRIFAAFLSNGYKAYGIRNEYHPGFILNPPRGCDEIVSVTKPPTGGLYDVLMTRIGIDEGRVADNK
jgi:FkbM family methyltransferase